MNRLYLLVLPLACLLHAPCSIADMVYKCKNSQGTLIYQEKPCAQENTAVGAWKNSAESAIESDGNNTMVIGQGNGGHYFVDGAINDQFLNFVIDTGATMVTIPQSLANNAKLKCISFGMMHTGNGTTQACSTVIQKLKFGSFTLYDVEALVAPNLGQPLLGMNVLKRFKMEQDGGVVRLSKKY